MVIYLLAFAMCGVIAASIAEKKNRRPGEAWCLALLSGPLAILVEARLPKLSNEDRRRQEDNSGLMWAVLGVFLFGVVGYFGYYLK